jgi:hypothetical protein
MKITETHKNFEGGAKGRVTVCDDAGTVIDAIYTPVQKARRFCEANPDTEAGRRYTMALHIASGGAPADASGETQAASVPAPPALTGANAANTALVSAQRKLVKLHEAAQGADPVLALIAIKTSRGNKYLNTCDDYRAALLAHFASRG